MAKIPQSEWKWFGNAGHFICSRDCQFHLCTQVGKFLISTVGELWGDRVVREIHAKIEDPIWFKNNVIRKGDDFDSAYMERFGFREIGYQRKYETMVFKAGPPCTDEKCNCGMPSLADPHEFGCEAYNTPGDATRGHLAMCEKLADSQERETAR